jgi:thioester reductase-like protein
MNPLRILVTGASGLLGAEVVSRLASGGHIVYALLHSTPAVVRNNGKRVPLVGADDPRPGSVASLHGDITRPRLGLSGPDYDALRGSLDRIVHSAALTDFGLGWDAYELRNVTSTRHVLEFASDGCRGAIPVVHISTAYVCGERNGIVRENELTAGQSFGTCYEKSKYEAELAVREAADRGLLTAIVRPSIVVGAERTGMIRDFKNMYIVLKMFTAGRVCSVPGFYDSILNLVPIDYVADLVSQVAIRFADAAGKTLHAINRYDHSLLDFSNVLAEYPSFHVPRYVPPSSFSVARLPSDERLYYERIVGLYESFFTRRTSFDDSEARAFLGRSLTVSGHAHLRRLLNYCLRVGYLGAQAPGIDDVLRELR